MSTELLQDIENRIKKLEERIEAGNIIRMQCKRQVSVLKKKLKEYKRLKETVVTKYVGEYFDGDL